MTDEKHYPISPNAVRKKCPVCGADIVQSDTPHLKGSHLNPDGTYHFKTCNLKSKKR